MQVEKMTRIGANVVSVAVAVILACSLFPTAGFADDQASEATTEPGALTAVTETTDPSENDVVDSGDSTDEAGAIDSLGSVDDVPQISSDSDSPTDGADSDTISSGEQDLGGTIDEDTAGSVSEAEEGESEEAIEDAEAEEEGIDAEEEAEDEKDDEVVSVEEAEQITGISASLEGVEYAAGEVIVSFDYGTTVEEADDAVAETEAVSTEYMSDEELLVTDVAGDELVNAMGFEPTAVVEVEEGLTVVQAIVELMKEPHVVAVEPNYFFFPADEEYAQPEDAYDFEAQGVKINDPQKGDQWSLMRSELYNAWSLATCDNTVGIAIIDTGCYTAHADLAPNIVATYNATNRGSDVTDNDGHGTHVAGIAAGVADNGTGIAGSSYNANLVIIKATDSDGKFNTATIMRAYEYITKYQSTYNIRVVNMSLGANWSGNPTYNWSSDIYGVAKCIARAKDNGILTVCAACNKQPSASYYPAYPGDFDGCLSVMNLNSNNVLDSTSNSNVGNTLGTANATKDICAPGTGILSTMSNGGYGYMTGTSMAAPFVSGIAALCFAADPSLGPESVMDVLESTAKQPDGSSGWTQLYGYGCVDANAALWNVTGQQYPSMPSAISIENATVSAIADQPWVADGVEPALSVTLDGTTLSEGTDYRLQYFDNYDVGTASVVIEGIGAYTGSITKTFAIKGNLAYATVSVSPTTVSYDGKPKTPAATVKFNGQKLAAGTDYAVTYANNTNLGTATLTVTGKGKYLGKKSTTFTIAGNLAMCSMTLSASTFTYNGQVKQPGVTVKLAGKTLRSGVDYTTTYTNNKLVGTAKVTVKGKGAYSGSNAKTFTIIPAKTTLSSATKVGSGVQLKWTKAPGATSYEVQRQIGTGAWVRVATVSGVGFIDAGAPGKKANYRVLSVATVSGKTYKSGVSATKSITLPTASVNYRVYYGGKGWQAWKGNGATSGITGKSLTTRAIQSKLSSQPYSGGITYRTHMQNKGWQPWRSNGATSGLPSNALRAEAVQMKLTGEMAKKYDIYYRVNCQRFGWSGWAKNGASAGTSGYGYRVDAMQVKLVAKGGKAPGSTANAFRKK